MHYLDIELGNEYVYQGRIVKVIGLRVITKANHARENDYFVTINLGSGAEVKPHELAPLPSDVETWNATVERPIGFRRLP